ncbi:hypothetical protein CHUAL_012496 [Chamberlinius hualienensis]
MKFASLNDYERFVELLSPLLQEQLVEHPYNTVGSFVRFYDSFKMQSKVPLTTFFRTYSPPITPEHHTCVGLGLDLVDRIRTSETLLRAFPSVGKHIQLSSCEEDYDASIQEYTLYSPPEVEMTFKEHVVASLKISIEGRIGVIVLDPGYHVARPVTVMDDRLYPHTGWFDQTKTSKVIKQYNYELTKDRKYVLWESVETRGGVAKHKPPSLIYINRNFLNCVDLVERRNFVYLFKVWVARDRMGQLKAGLHFAVQQNGQFTLFYHNKEGERVDCKIHFRYFQQDNERNNLFEKAVVEVEKRVGSGCPLGLRSYLTKIANIIDDESFILETIKINDMMES